MKEKKYYQRLVVLVTVCSIMAGMTGTAMLAEEEDDFGLKNPVIQENSIIWDCIWFGNYYQNDTNGDGEADKDDEKEAVKWRILSINQGKALLIADKNLECQPYHGIESFATWEDSEIRKWMHLVFINSIFTSEEQAAILEKTITTETSPIEIPWQNTTVPTCVTKDKIYLLSAQEAMNEEYGMAKKFIESNTRKAVNTQYVKNVLKSSGNEVKEYGDWWLRNLIVGGEPSAITVYDNGSIGPYGSGVRAADVCVRPVLCLDLQDTDTWQHAGTVSSDGTVKEQPDRMTTSEMKQSLQKAATGSILYGDIDEIPFINYSKELISMPIELANECNVFYDKSSLVKWAEERNLKQIQNEAKSMPDTVFDDMAVYMTCMGTCADSTEKINMDIMYTNNNNKCTYVKWEDKGEIEGEQKYYTVQMNIVLKNSAICETIIHDSEQINNH